MDSDKRWKLLAQLHSNNSPQTLAYVERCLQEEGLTMADLFGQVEMPDRPISAFVNERKRSFSSPTHIHNFWELTYCQSNCGIQVTLDGTRHILQRGDIVCIPPGCPHASFVPESGEESTSDYVVWISPDFLRGVQEEFPYLRQDPAPGGTVLHTVDTVWEPMGTLFQIAAMESGSHAPGWEAALHSLTVLMLTHLTRALAETAIQPQSGGKQELLDQLLEYVEINLGEKITLEDVAKRFWVSQSTITHLFNKKMGISFRKYIIRRRLAEAKNLIAENMPMEKVAVRVGFGDYSAFYRAFKQEYGISPLQFRKNNIDSAQTTE